MCRYDWSLSGLSLISHVVQLIRASHMDFLLGNAEISVGLLSDLLSKMFNRLLKYIKRHLASFVYSDGTL